MQRALDNLSRIETLGHTDNDRNTAAYNWRYLKENHLNVELIRADIRDFEALQDVVEGHDAIVHTAGQVAVTSSLEDPRTDFEVNAAGTFNVLEAARFAESDPSLVFASTNKVYGGNVNDVPVREEGDRYVYDDPEYERGIPETFSIDGCEHTPYGVSKLAADQYVQGYARRGAVDAAAFRMSCIYGTPQFGNEDQGWVAYSALSALENEPLTIFGNGKQVRDVLFVDDLIRAYDAFLQESEGKPPVYNIGGGVEHTTSLLEFLDLLESVTGTGCDVTYEEWCDGDQRVYISDVGRAEEELIWEPKIDLRTGIERFVDWHRSH